MRRDTDNKYALEKTQTTTQITIGQKRDYEITDTICKQVYQTIESTLKRGAS